MTDSHDDRATVLVALAEELWRAALAGHGSPEGAERVRRMQRPQFGDVVFVHFARSDALPSHLIGRYDSSWSYIGERDADGWNGWSGGGDLVYGIETFDGEYVSWTNVELLALPPTLTEHLHAWMESWVKERAMSRHAGCS